MQVKVAGFVAYIADRAGGLVVMDTSPGANPTRAGNFKGGGNVVALDVANDLVFLAEQSGLIRILQTRWGKLQTLQLVTPKEIFTNSPPVKVTSSSSSRLPSVISVVSGPATIAEGLLRVTGSDPVTLRVLQGGNEVFAPAMIEVTIAPLLPPRLEIQYELGALKLAWPLVPSGFSLESSPSVEEPFWAPVVGTRLGVAGKGVLTLSLPDEPQFYRLVRK